MTGQVLAAPADASPDTGAPRARPDPRGLATPLIRVYDCADGALLFSAPSRDAWIRLARALEIDEKVLARYLYEPGIPDVDLFVRSSGEQRISNFLLWQSAYAELVFLDTLFPDFDRRHLWQACEIYASRDRRYGGAQPNLPAVTST